MEFQNNILWKRVKICFKYSHLQHLLSLWLPSGLQVPAMHLLGQTQLYLQVVLLWHPTHSKLPIAWFGPSGTSRGSGPAKSSSRDLVWTLMISKGSGRVRGTSPNRVPGHWSIARKTGGGSSLFPSEPELESELEPSWFSGSEDSLLSRSDDSFSGSSWWSASGLVSGTGAFRLVVALVRMSGTYSGSMVMVVSVVAMVMSVSGSFSWGFLAVAVVSLEACKFLHQPQIL